MARDSKGDDDARSECSQSSFGIRTESFANPSVLVPEQHAGPADSAWALRRRFFLPIIAPGVLQGKANQIVAPMLPIFAREDLHASDTVVGLLLTTTPIANLCVSIPIGLLVARLDYGVANCLALGGLIALSIASYFVPSVPLFFILRFLCGSFLNLFDLSRKTWLAAELPNKVRSRITATIAGCNKLGVVVASLLSGLSAQHLSNRSIFLLQAGFSLVSLLMVLLYLLTRSRDTRRPDNQSERKTHSTHVTTSGVFKSNWRKLLGGGCFCALLSGIRNAWQLVLPLQAHSSGQSKQTIGILVACVRATEVIITLTIAGQFMDKFGRRCTALPAVCLMGLAHGLIALCDNTMTLLLGGLLYGIGNGLSGGIIVAYQTALAPNEGRSQFIALFKMIQSLGGLTLPPLVGLMSDLSGSLVLGGLCMAASSGLTCLFLVFCVSDNWQDSTSLSDERQESSGGQSLTSVRQLE